MSYNVKDQLRAYARLRDQIDTLYVLLNAETEKYGTSGQGLGVQRSREPGNTYIELKAQRRWDIGQEIDRLNTQAAEIWQGPLAEAVSSLPPVENLIVRLRYDTRISWEKIAAAIYGTRQDFAEKQEKYRQQVYTYHGKALQRLQESIDKQKT